MDLGRGLRSRVLACDDVDLVAGDAKILELAIGELLQFADGLAIAPIVADLTRIKAKNMGNS